MEVKGMVRLGTRTSSFDATVHGYRDVMGLEISQSPFTIKVFFLPSSSKHPAR